MQTSLGAEIIRTLCVRASYLHLHMQNLSSVVVRLRARYCRCKWEMIELRQRILNEGSAAFAIDWRRKLGISAHGMNGETYNYFFCA